jgi:hypothetical protein
VVPVEVAGCLLGDYMSRRKVYWIEEWIDGRMGIGIFLVLCVIKSIPSGWQPETHALAARDGQHPVDGRQPPRSGSVRLQLTYSAVELDDMSADLVAALAKADGLMKVPYAGAVAFNLLKKNVSFSNVNFFMLHLL